MQGIHVYKINSRLGLKNRPAGGKTFNLGVEDGADAVATPAYLSRFNGSSKTFSYTFPTPETLHSTPYGTVLAQHIKACVTRINSHTHGASVQLAVGGDHSIAACSLLALLTRKNPKQVGYIQFDSHADVNSFATSPSGNFHGMWLRPFIETIDDAALARVFSKRLAPDHICIIGNLILDPGEIALLKKYKIMNISQRTLAKGRMKKFLASYIKHFAHLHVSFDIDVFDKTIAPATGTPNNKGLFPQDVFPLLEIIAQHPSLSIDLVEVNPKKRGVNKTVRLAQDVLTTLLKKNMQ